MARTSRRGPWLPEEDSALIELVRTQGPNNWVRISQQLQHRSPKQCRERYHQNLKPSLNHDPISAQEGERIEQLVEEMGKRWAEIARRLGNRSDNAVKNWWNGSINRRKRSPSSQSSTRHSHSGNRLHPVPSNVSQLPRFEVGDRVTPVAAPLNHHHFRDPWSATSSVPESDDWNARMNKLPAMTTQLSSRCSEQQRHLDLLSYDVRRDHADSRSQLPPLRLPPITRGSMELSYTAGAVTGIEKPSISPALSDFSHTYSTRAVPSLVSDNQSTCSTSPRTLTSPKASATHYTDSRSHRWSPYERSHSYGYQGIKGQLALSPLQIETLVMPPILNRLESPTSRHESHLHDNEKRPSYEPENGRRMESLRDSRMHVSSLVQ